MQTEKPPRRSWLRRILRAACLLSLGLVLLAVAWCLYAWRDRDPSAAFVLDVGDTPAVTRPKPLAVGFGQGRITPDVSNSQRPVWLAGFDQDRAATGVHDDLWATAMVIDDGYSRLGIVSLDAIGLFHEDVMRIRRRLPPDVGITYAIVCSTHNHNTPDLMGLWGPDLLHTGVDPEYRELVISNAVQALREAAEALQPARVALHEIKTTPEGLVHDTRKPVVFDSDLRVMHFTSLTNGSTLGTLVGWADHPETIWSRNTEITSDFCGYLRDALQHGVTAADKPALTGVGGIHVFVNGAVGGLMTTPEVVTVHDPCTGEDYTKPSHDKARALGRQLASRILPRLATEASATNHAPISIRARTLEIPLDNFGFMIAPMLGLLDRGHSGWMKLRTEVALVTVGDASLACVPGEIYPEIVNGGVERAPGGDFDIDPVEVPPLREFMPGKVKFVLGLANDEIGYIIPKSEWDREPPFLYGSSHGVYGEVNSVGPEAAPLIHAALREFSKPWKPEGAVAAR